MSPFSVPLADLKLALQNLESHVQLPRDEQASINRIVATFPSVMDHFTSILSEGLRSEGQTSDTALDVISDAHSRGWLKGDKVLWLRLMHDYAELSDTTLSSHALAAIAEDVRSCSYMFWQSYEYLNARFRWQTQARSVPIPMSKFSTVPAA